MSAAFKEVGNGKNCPMNMDLHHNILAVPAIEPQQATSTQVSALIDLQAQGSPSGVEVLCHVGALTSGEWSFSITEGNAANGSDQAAPAASSILGTMPNLVATANTIGSFGYIGICRYIQITATATNVAGSGGNGEIAATLILGYTRKPPTVTP